MNHIIAPGSLPRQVASLIALVGIALVICSFILERAPAGSKWRRVAFAFITAAGCGLGWLGAWLVFQAT